MKTKFLITLVFYGIVFYSYAQLKYTLSYPIKDIFIEQPKLNKFDTFYQDSFEIIIKVLDLKGKSIVNINKNKKEYQCLEFSNGEVLLTDVVEVINIETGISFFKYFEFYYPILYSLDEKNKKKKLIKYDTSEYIRINK